MPGSEPAFCYLTIVDGREKKTAWFSLAELTPSPGSSEKKICILTGSKLRKHDMESRRDCSSFPEVWFFNRLTFGIWGKSQQLAGQNFHNCPLGRAVVCLEIILLDFVVYVLAFVYKCSCFLRHGNVDELPVLLHFTPLYLWPLTEWLAQ